MDALGAELIPSPTAAGDFTRRFSESGVIELMECVNAAGPKLWRGRGRDLPGPVAYVDVDGTPAPTLGRKKAGMDMSHKGALRTHKDRAPTRARRRNPIEPGAQQQAYGQSRFASHGSVVKQPS